jgi:response regulator RpfG family c-di-GMP phosphodiesterase
MKTHARIGFDILKYSQSEYLKAGAVISYSHHEKYDGSGYPIGLIGETIPIPGRIVAIADVFDALTHERPYKKAWSIEEACAFLVEEKGRHFDPKLVDLFMQNLDEIKSIKNKFSDVA